MAVTDQQIKDFVSANINNPQAIANAAAQYGVGAADISRATGYSAEQVKGYASQNGVSFGGAVEMGSTRPEPVQSFNLRNESLSTPAPAPAPTYYGGGRALTGDKLTQARQWSTGKSAQEIGSKASEMGFNADQLGQVFGWAGSDVSRATGYTGQGASGGVKDEYAGWKFNGADWGNPVNSQTPNMGARLSSDQITAVRNWLTQQGDGGRTSSAVLREAAARGFTPEQLGQLFGWAEQDVRSVLGYTGQGEFGGAKAEYVGDDWVFNGSEWAKVRRGNVLPQGMPQLNLADMANLQGQREAAQWEVAPNQTVATQLAQILAQDSPLMQQARTRAMQAMQARGGLNSTMAATAGESAMYDAALPIAQQDASTYADAAKFNAGERNVFSRDLNAFLRDGYMANFNLQANDWAGDRDLGRKLQLQDAQNVFARSEREASQGFQTGEREASQGYQTGERLATQGYQSGEAQADRDWRGSEATSQRDWQTAQNQLDREMQVQVAGMRSAGGGSSSVDTGALTARDIAATRNTRYAQLLELSSNLTTNISTIEGGSGTADQKRAAIDSLYDGLSRPISAISAELGLNASDYLPVRTTATAPAPAPSPAVSSPAASAPPPSAANDNGGYA